MKRLSLCLGFIAVTLVYFSRPLCAEEKSGQFFGTLDYYLAGDVGDEIESSFKELADESTAGGDPATAETDIKNGVGVRFGYLRNLNPNFSLGGSLGYIAGPKIESKFTDLPGGVSGIDGYVNATYETSYIRFLAEGVGKYPLNDRVSLNLGVGLGVAQAKTTQEYSVSASNGFITVSGTDEFDESAVGFTWEISPSVDINFEKVALMLGLRYTQLPKIKESDNTAEIDWTAFGFFAGLKF